MRTTLLVLLLAVVLASFSDPPDDPVQAWGYCAAVAFVALLIVGVALDWTLHITGWPAGGAKADEVSLTYHDGWKTLIAWLVLLFLARFAWWPRRARWSKPLAAVVNWVERKLSPAPSGTSQAPKA